jgi:hypothetical protein
LLFTSINTGGNIIKTAGKSINFSRKDYSKNTQHEIEKVFNNFIIIRVFILLWKELKILHCLVEKNDMADDVVNQISLTHILQNINKG